MIIGKNKFDLNEHAKFSKNLADQITKNATLYTTRHELIKPIAKEALAEQRELFTTKLQAFASVNPYGYGILLRPEAVLPDISLLRDVFLKARIVTNIHGTPDGACPPNKHFAMNYCYSCCITRRNRVALRAVEQEQGSLVEAQLRTLLQTDLPK